MRNSSAIGLLIPLIVFFGLLLLLPAGLRGQSGGGTGASAANEAISWYVIAGGGVIGSTNGGTTVLSGTVGQGIIGRVTNSTGVAFQGFWVPLDGKLTEVPRDPVIAGLRTHLTNYPNPFATSTTISYFVNERSRIRLEVFNRLGQSVRVLMDDLNEVGDHTVTWDGFDTNGSRLASGAYLYRISVQPLGPLGSETFTEQNQMMIVR